jgi:hypothetical protein
MAGDTRLSVRSSDGAASGSLVPCANFTTSCTPQNQVSNSAVFLHTRSNERSALLLKQRMDWSQSPHRRCSNTAFGHHAQHTHAGASIASAHGGARTRKTLTAMHSPFLVNEGEGERLYLAHRLTPKHRCLLPMQQAHHQCQWYAAYLALRAA